MGALLHTWAAQNIALEVREAWGGDYLTEACCVTMTRR